MDESTQKRCPRCDKHLPLESFGPNRRMKDGLQLHCKPCRADFQREYRRRHPDKMRRWGREQMARRRVSDPEAVRDYMRQWRTANPNLVRAAKSAWEAANYERHRETSRESSRRFKKANPNKRRADDLRRRARKQAASVGVVDLAALWNEQGGICALCSLPIDRELAWPHPLSASVDHIFPISKGGPHAQDNLQWVHLIENIRKGASVPQ